VIAPYVPVLAKNASAYSDPLSLMIAVDDEIRYTPEYYNSYFTEDESFGCRYGGTFTFGPGDAGENFTFENCGFLEGFSITGTGSYDYDAGVFTLEMQVTGTQEGTLTYTRKDNEGTYSLTGTYGGQDIDLNQ
jgi:hypothetical protein